jgi:hypothetical protein
MSTSLSCEYEQITSHLTKVSRNANNYRSDEKQQTCQFWADVETNQQTGNKCRYILREYAELATYTLSDSFQITINNGKTALNRIPKTSWVVLKNLQRHATYSNSFVVRSPLWLVSNQVISCLMICEKNTLRSRYTCRSHAISQHQVCEINIHSLLKYQSFVTQC